MATLSEINNERVSGASAVKSGHEVRGDRHSSRGC
jgi:hypothetical protein